MPVFEKALTFFVCAPILLCIVCAPSQLAKHAFWPFLTLYSNKFVFMSLQCIWCVLFHSVFESKWMMTLISVNTCVFYAHTTTTTTGCAFNCSWFSIYISFWLLPVVGCHLHWAFCLRSTEEFIAINVILFSRAGWWPLSLTSFVWRTAGLGPI